MNTSDNNRIIDIENLFRQHYRRLCNVAHRIINDRTASEDIVQGIFEKLWNKKDELQINTTAEGYLVRATSNAALNYLESRKRIIPIDFAATSLQTDPITPEKALAYSEFQEKVKTALDKLPPKCKAIFALSRFEGMKYKEIAEHLDISIKTVENQMGIALEKLREDLKPYLTKEFLPVAVGIGLSLLFQLLSYLLLIYF